METPFWHPDVLEDNYSLARLGWVGPPIRRLVDCSTALATHTFPDERAWGRSDAKRIRVYDSILFQQCAVLSEASRRRLAHLPVDDLSRRAKEWRRPGLIHLCQATSESMTLT